MSVTNCNCPEKLDCGCTLAFSSYLSPAVPVLNAGTLTATGCVISGYVIDWYRDGVWYMASASANGLETGISAIHPFTGTGAIPVMAGIYSPVVRYVVIDGKKVYPQKRPCRRWCPMTINLPAITVTALNCLTGNPLSSGYQYTLSYLSSMDYSLASRLVNIDLSAGVVQFAWYFTGKTIADHIEIFHSRTGRVFADWVIGSELTYVNFTGFPHAGGFWGEKKGCFNLPPYQQGDSLVVRITPNYLGSGYNTEWQFSYKCLAAALVPPVISRELRAYDIDTLDFTYDPAGCRFLLKVKFDHAFPSVDAGYVTYAGVNRMTSNSYWNFGNNWHGISYYYSTRPALSYNYPQDTVKKNLGTQSVTVTKSGAVYVFSFSDAADYQVVKANYNAMLNTAAYTGWVNDPSDVRYYRLFDISWGQTVTGCGDNEVNSRYRFFIRCSVAFDDALNTVAITSVSVPNALPDSADPCNKVKTEVDTYVYYMNQTRDAADFTATSRCLYTGMFKNTYYFTGIQFGSLSSNGSGTGFSANGADNDPDGIVDASKGWYTPAGQSYSSDSVQMMIFMWAIRITASRDANGNWLTDPLLNFYVIEWVFDPVTQFNGSSRKIYEMVNGTVVLKRVYDGT